MFLDVSHGLLFNICDARALPWPSDPAAVTLAIIICGTYSPQLNQFGTL